MIHGFMPYQNILILILHTQIHGNEIIGLGDNTVQHDTIMDNKEVNGLLHSNGSSAGQYEGFVSKALNIKSITRNDDNVNINPLKKRKLR